MTEEEGFDDLLQGVRDRVDEIESLHRTRELTVSRFISQTLVFHLQAFNDAFPLSSRIWRRVIRSDFPSIKVVQGACYGNTE